MTNYYVYYRVEPARLGGLKEQIEKLFDSIETRTGIRGRWLRRRDDPGTYMEVYEGVQDDAAFDALLDREGAKLGLQRKVEVFMVDSVGKSV